MSIYQEIRHIIARINRERKFGPYRVQTTGNAQQFRSEGVLADSRSKHVVVPLTKRQLKAVPCGNIETPLDARRQNVRENLSQKGGVKILLEIFKIIDNIQSGHKGVYWLNVEKGEQKAHAFQVYYLRHSSGANVMMIELHELSCSFSANTSDRITYLEVDRDAVLSCVNMLDKMNNDTPLQGGERKFFSGLVAYFNHPVFFELLSDLLRVLRFSFGVTSLPETHRHKGCPTQNSVSKLKNTPSKIENKLMAPFYIRRVPDLIEDAENYLLEEADTAAPIEADQAQNAACRQRRVGTALHWVRPHWRHYKQTNRRILVPGHWRGQLDKLPITRISPCQRKGEPERQVDLKRAA